MCGGHVTDVSPAVTSRALRYPPPGTTVADMHPRHIVLGTVFVTLLVTPPSTLFASLAQLAAIPLSVRVYDTAGLPDSTRDGALTIAAAALDAADIDTVWRRCWPTVAPGAKVGDLPRTAKERRQGVPADGAGCDAPPLGDELVIRIVGGRTPAAGSKRMTLGDALLDRSSGSGRLATIYFDRVDLLARAAAVDVTRVLGYAIAHELGHLLLATASHSRDGLMRAVWSHDDVRRARGADWRFTKREIAAIRARAGARMTHLVWGD